MNPKGVKITNSDDDEDVNPFQREEDASSPVRDIETMDIEVKDSLKKGAYTSDSKKNGRSSGGGIGEPEPEMIKESPDCNLTSFVKQNQFTSNNKQASGGQTQGDDEIGEELDEDEYEQFSQHEEDPEE